MCTTRREHKTHNHSQTALNRRNHVAPEPERDLSGCSSRRDFLRLLMGGALSGASLLEMAYHRAAWARGAASGSDVTLFDLQPVGGGVFFARAKPQTEINCNAAVFVRSNDVVVVDAHSKPSAAAGLIAQIRREVTTKPVRYLINTHFHWDHTQGNHAYRAAEQKIDFIATNATKRSMEELAVQRLKESLAATLPQIEALRKRAESATSDAEKKFCAGEIEHLKAYQKEMENYSPELPTITFDDSYELKDAALDLHLGFHGRAHTAGDVFVYCPQQRALSTGDASHGWLPFLFDAFPKSWPKTIDTVTQIDFKYVLGGHGPMQSDRTVMTCQRNYIEELTERVDGLRQKGLTAAEMQKEITVASLKSMESNGYSNFLLRSEGAGHPFFGRPQISLQDEVGVNIADIYKNLDRS